jgi:DNA protecting protein DprA
MNETNVTDLSHLGPLVLPQAHPWLREISDPPKQVFYQGEIETFFSPCFSIVGTRRPSWYGVRMALTFSKQLALRGLTIVSGLARGIDSYAHRGALWVGGKTIAVLGHGLGRIYPPENQGLAQQILQSRGGLVSEYSANTPPLKHHFPQRNRIISGLSLGTLIIEAAQKSGSLITAYCALEQNREVFVVPSQLDQASFVGSHRLVQEGAKMVMKVEDILEELPVRTDFKSLQVDSGPHDYDLLKNEFEKNFGVLTLATLYNFPKNKREFLKKEIDQAILDKKVYDVNHQQFIWID